VHIVETRRAPNPRRVRIFLAEKGIGVDFQELDLMAGDLKTESFTKLNGLQRVPVLVLDSGETVCETMAICRYFDKLQPEPCLFGSTALEIALIEMWQRRIELGLFNYIAHVFRHLNAKMAHLEIPQVAAWGEANKPKVERALVHLDEQLSENQFIAGDDYSVADITALVAIDFMKPAKLTMPNGMTNLLRWHREVSLRPSSNA
jgi:glutathione S-transferase